MKSLKYSLQRDKKVGKWGWRTVWLAAIFYLESPGMLSGTVWTCASTTPTWNETHLTRGCFPLIPVNTSNPWKVLIGIFVLVYSPSMFQGGLVLHPYRDHSAFFSVTLRSNHDRAAKEVSIFSRLVDAGRCWGVLDPRAELERLKKLFYLFVV